MQSSAADAGIHEHLAKLDPLIVACEPEEELFLQMKPGIEAEDTCPVHFF